MKDIKDEIIERNKPKEDYGQVVGIEVRYRRTLLSQTLAATAAKICSISYLSKIENNSIEASPLYLREICAKVELDENQINLLMNLKKIIESSIISYLNNDEKTLSNNFKSGKGLENFRYKIIEFIYYLYKKDINNANSIYEVLIRVSSTMSDFDLYVFSLFSGILFYYNQFYLECFETLKLLTNLKVSNEFNILRDKYIFLALFSMNSCDTGYAYKVLRDILFENSKYLMLEEANYIYSIFLLNNNSFYEYDNISKKITDIKYKESLRLYFDFLKKDMSLSSYDKDNLTSFARLILLTKTDKSKAEDEVDKPEIAFEYDMNKMLIKYLLIDNEADKYKFITDVALPNAQRNNDMHNTNYFMDELASISMHNFKYKVFTTFYYKISNKTF